MAHAVLMRTNTAPALQTTANGVGGLNKMNSAPRSSQLSSATTFAGSSASLSSLATVVPQNGGPVVATTNIINQKADASRSLYQICVSLKQRLSQVPDFQAFLDQLDPNEPVDSLWNLFRSGHPLLIIYNCLQPGEPLKVEDPNASEPKKSKIAVFKFVQACLKDLQMPPADTFVITDLMGTDTSGFVKVCGVCSPALVPPTSANASSPLGNASRQLCARSRRTKWPPVAGPTLARTRLGRTRGRCPDDLQRPHCQGACRHRT